jgi:hypothetical protein
MKANILDFVNSEGSLATSVKDWRAVSGNFASNRAPVLEFRAGENSLAAPEKYAH